MLARWLPPMGHVLCTRPWSTHLWEAAAVPTRPSGQVPNRATSHSAILLCNRILTRWRVLFSVVCVTGEEDGRV